ncbi:TatD family hydrolase [Marinomonas epiphytica]
MYIDSHCHLDFSVFDATRDHLMKACEEQDIKGFLVPATTYASWQPLHKMSLCYKNWRLAYGLHPYFLDTADDTQLSKLGWQCEEFNSIAVGEIGLDFWPGAVDEPIQTRFFKAQLNIANALKLPVIIHARKSYDQVLKYLRQCYFSYGGVVHAFNGSLVQAKRFRELGFVMGIGGTVTYPRAQKAQRVLSALENDDFVLETDSPDMPLHGFQGQVNTPLAIPRVAQQIALLRGENIALIKKQAYDNLIRVFPSWNKESL